MLSWNPYLISLSPLPDAWGLHTKHGERVPADNNQSNHHQFEHRQEGSNVSEERQQENTFQYNNYRRQHNTDKSQCKTYNQILSQQCSCFM